MNDRNWHARAESAKIRRLMRTENTHVRFRTRESSDSGKKMQATESGVEFKMLAKLFTEEEASLACHMRLEAETAAAIAAKAVTEPVETRNTLKRVMAKGLIDIRKREKEEALKILRETEEAGLVHSSGNYRDGVEYICNCCICCCGIMRVIAEFGIMSAVAHSDLRLLWKAIHGMAAKPASDDASLRP